MTNTKFVSSHACVVDREPLPGVYIPEQNDFINIYRVSMHKIMRIEGKSSSAVIR